VLVSAPTKVLVLVLVLKKIGSLGLGLGLDTQSLGLGLEKKSWLHHWSLLTKLNLSRKAFCRQSLTPSK